MSNEQVNRTISGRAHSSKGTETPAKVFFKFAREIDSVVLVMLVQMKDIGTRCKDLRI
jgi:hypothetical protein